VQDAPFIGNGSLCCLPNAQLSQNVMSNLLSFGSLLTSIYLRCNHINTYTSICNQCLVLCI
jgi:hypothetical protein